MGESYLFYVDRLQGPYLEAFAEIMCYCRTAIREEEAREERLSALLDEFLQAQAEGVPVERITGGNLDRFCQNLCEDRAGQMRWWTLLDRLRPVVWWLTVMLACAAVLASSGELTRAGGWTGMAMLAASAYLLWQVLDTASRSLLRRRANMPAAWMEKVFSVGAALVSIVPAVLVWRCRPELVLPVVPMLAVCLLALAADGILGRKRPPETRTAPAEPTRDDPVHKMVLEETPPMQLQMTERFRRMNRKRQRRGQPPITRAEFFAQVRRDIDAQRRWMPIGSAVIAAVCVGLCVMQDYRSTAEAVLTVVLIAVCCVGGLSFFRRQTKAETGRMEEWLTRTEAHPEEWTEE